MNLTREEVLAKVRLVGLVCLPSPWDRLKAWCRLRGFRVNKADQVERILKGETCDVCRYRCPMSNAAGERFLACGRGITLDASQAPRTDPSGTCEHFRRYDPFGWMAEACPLVRL